MVAGKTFKRGATVVIRPGAEADIQARMLDGRTATIEKIFTDYDGKTHLGVTIDDDPGPGADARDRPLSVFLPGRGGGDRNMSGADEQLRSILVAGVGNAWLRDDGFGGEVARGFLRGNCQPA